MQYPFAVYLRRIIFCVWLIVNLAETMSAEIPHGYGGNSPSVKSARFQRLLPPVYWPRSIDNQHYLACPRS